MAGMTPHKKMNSAAVRLMASSCHALIAEERPMRIDAISIGRTPPKEVTVVVAAPVGGEPIKYERDKRAGTLGVDRFVDTALLYPGNYGFIPHPRQHDGDP